MGDRLEHGEEPHGFRDVVHAEDRGAGRRRDG
jgi:hypothetical protein